MAALQISVNIDEFESVVTGGNNLHNKSKATALFCLTGVSSGRMGPRVSAELQSVTESCSKLSELFSLLLVCVK